MDKRRTRQTAKEARFEIGKDDNELVRNKADEICGDERTGNIDHVRSELRKFYKEMIGDTGYEKFEEVLERASTLYRNNERKMCERVLAESIYTSTFRAKDIEARLQALFSDELALQKELPTMAELEPEINAAILEGKRRKSDVVAVIVCGSYARGDQRPDSDLDIQFVVRATDDPYTEATDDALRTTRHLREIIIETVNDPVCINDQKKLGEDLFDPDGLVRGTYVIISPFEKVKEKIRKAVEKYKGKR